MTIEIETRVKTMSKIYRTGELATVVGSYRALGSRPDEFVVRFDDGTEVAYRETDLVEHVEAPRLGDVCDVVEY